jgi:hypothetical protein
MSFSTPTASLFSAARLAVAISAIATIAAAPCALASDGALEIHQACVATGCFPGDPPGFPVLITENGSYVLTSNLDVPDENTTAIQSDAAVVSIDLGGFVISGVTECTTGPTVCTPVGTGRGVDISGDSIGSVRNGTVRKMGAMGILARGGTIEDVLAQDNGTIGILTTEGLIHRCRAVTNGDVGLVANTSTILDSEAAQNGGRGIWARFHSYVRGNRVHLNGSVGDQPGIEADGAYVWQNVVTFSAGPGLEAGASVAYGHNHFRDNQGASTPANQVNGGVQLGPNLCQGAPCP